MFGKRILIAAAHPDDEIVACAASITRARAAGATVSAIYLTNGCIPQNDMWFWQRKNYAANVAKRRAEAEAAALSLGIQPVGWGDRPARHLWRHMVDAQRELNAAVTLYRPDQLWVPAYEGGNPDHDALNALGFGFKMRLSVLEFAEYNFFGGAARSNKFVSSDETVRTITLTQEEQSAKRVALALYKSERGNLSSMQVEQEAYRPISAYDYNQPPHQGTLWYTRFQWVPFRHPRVDFTKPAEVSAAIADSRPRS